ncbi:hypothetical protein GCM10017687_63390 [Streptomyces echinatus]
MKRTGGGRTAASDPAWNEPALRETLPLPRDHDRPGRTYLARAEPKAFRPHHAGVRPDTQDPHPHCYAEFR